MRAVIQHGYGGADTWRVGDLPDPVASGKQVVVRVRAAGIDRGTWHLMTGTPYVRRPFVGLRGLRSPVPGRDLAGVVEAVGPGVSGFAPGDEVYGVAGGTLAELVVARADKLAPKPANLSFEEAAVVPVSGLTALQALGLGRVGAGHRVLITGASGGVGSYLVQLAKAAGAEVTGVSGPDKTELVKFLGADHVLDYTTDDFADGATRYDVVFDIAGNPSLDRLRKALTPKGTAVIVGGEGGGLWFGGLGRPLRARLASPFIGQRMTNFVAAEKGLDRLAAALSDGTVKPCLDSAYPLDRAADAMRRLDSGQVRGKVAITI